MPVAIAIPIPSTLHMPVSATTVPSNAPFVATKPAPRKRDHPIEIQTRIELVKMAYAELHRGAVTSGITAVAFAIGMEMSGDHPVAAVWLWPIFIAIAAAYGVWLAAAFQRATIPEAEFGRWGLHCIV